MLTMLLEEISHIDIVSLFCGEAYKVLWSKTISSDETNCDAS